MLHYQEEWKRSIAESHRDNASREALLADFAGKTEILHQALTALGVQDLDEAHQAAAGLHQELARPVWF